MKPFSLAIGLAALAALALDSIAAPPTQKPPQQQQVARNDRAYKPRGADSKPVNPPPTVNRPGQRYRGGDGRPVVPANTIVEVVAPDVTSSAVGMTASSAPTVVWYTNRTDIARAVLKINDPSQGITLGSAQLPIGGAPGYRAVNLAKLGIPQLRSNVVYVWFVEVTFRDRVTAVVGSSIRHMPFGTDVAATCGTDFVCASTLLAGEGYWYDAIDRIALTGMPPTDPRSQALWRQLLNEVGLQQLP